MAKSRLKLQEELEDILGSKNVYYQPPESLKLKSPCIVYNRRDGDTRFANNNPYAFTYGYDVTVIDKNPDSEITPRLATSMPMCTFNRHFTADNLNHDVFILYY